MANYADVTLAAVTGGLGLLGGIASTFLAYRFQRKGWTREDELAAADRERQSKTALDDLYVDYLATMRHLGATAESAYVMADQARKERALEETVAYVKQANHLGALLDLRAPAELAAAADPMASTVKEMVSIGDATYVPGDPMERLQRCSPIRDRIELTQTEFINAVRRATGVEGER